MRLYLDAKDTCEEVGITRRQLDYWIRFELLTPELGKNKFTECEVAQLKALRRLIVCLGISPGALRKPELILSELAAWQATKEQQPNE